MSYSGQLTVQFSFPTRLPARLATIITTVPLTACAQGRRERTRGPMRSTTSTIDLSRCPLPVRCDSTTSTVHDRTIALTAHELNSLRLCPVTTLPRLSLYRYLSKFRYVDVTLTVRCVLLGLDRDLLVSLSRRYFDCPRARLISSLPDRYGPGPHTSPSSL